MVDGEQYFYERMDRRLCDTERPSTGSYLLSAKSVRQVVKPVRVAIKTEGEEILLGVRRESFSGVWQLVDLFCPFVFLLFIIQ